MVNGNSETNERRFSQEQYGKLLDYSKRGEEGIKKWNEWRDNNPTIEILLEGADLEDTDLKCADLRHAHLKGAVLTNARLDGANLEGANLKGVDSWKANFKGANLDYVDLQGAGLRGADLQDATLFADLLQDADLVVANLQNADFSNALLQGANLDQAKLQGSIFLAARFEGSYLRNVFLGEAECEGEDGVKMVKFTDFAHALLGDAVFSINEECTSSAEEVVCALSEAEVNNVRFLDPVFGRNVRDASWLRAYRKGCTTRFARFKCWLWRATCDYGRSIRRWALISLGMALFFAFLIYLLRKDFVFASGNWASKYWFTPIYYSVVTFTTLGFGDVTPKLDCLLAQIVVIAEVICGYVMLGGLISILANKLARRND